MTGAAPPRVRPRVWVGVLLVTLRSRFGETGWGNGTDQLAATAVDPRDGATCRF